MKAKIFSQLFRILSLAFVFLGSFALLSTSDTVRVIGLVLLLSIPFLLALAKREELRSRARNTGPDPASTQGLVERLNQAEEGIKRLETELERLQTRLSGMRVQVNTELSYIRGQINSLKIEIWRLQAVSKSMPDDTRLRAIQYLAQSLPIEENRRFFETIVSDNSTPLPMRKEAEYGLGRIDRKDGKPK